MSLMILATRLRPWVDSAGQGVRDGLAEMRIGLLATLKDKLRLFPDFLGMKPSKPT